MTPKGERALAQLQDDLRTWGMALKAVESSAAVLQKETAAGSETAHVRAVINEYEDVILSALGEGKGDFPDRPEGNKEPFYWRRWLRRRLVDAQRIRAQGVP